MYHVSLFITLQPSYFTLRECILLCQLQSGNIRLTQLWLNPLKGEMQGETEATACGTCFFIASLNPQALQTPSFQSQPQHSMSSVNREGQK